MFERPHHQRIAKVLQAFNRDLLQKAECYFGGGTAIVLSLGEYRESVDIDFLCSSNDGYRLLRNEVSNDLGSLLSQPVKHLREVRTDQYKIYTVLEVDGIPIKVELVREARVSISGHLDPVLNVPILSRVDMYAQKLLANADRGLDKSVMSRDIIDLAMMIKGWGAIPDQAWQKASDAYGEHLAKAFHKSVGLICDEKYLASCLQKMKMDAGLVHEIPSILENASSQLPLDELARKERERRIVNLSSLQQGSGASYAFWRHADESLKVAGSLANVIWPEVETRTIIESFGDDDQSAESIGDAICKHSPGAVTPERQAVILCKIDRIVLQRQDLNDQAQADEANKGYGFKPFG